MSASSTSALMNPSSSPSWADTHQWLPALIKRESPSVGMDNGNAILQSNALDQVTNYFEKRAILLLTYQGSEGTRGFREAPESAKGVKATPVTKKSDKTTK